MKIKNKKGISVQTWVIASILFSGIFALFILSIGSFAEQYDASGNVVDSELEARYNKLDNFTSQVERIKDTVQQPEGLSLIGEFRVLFSSTLGVLNTVLSSINLIPSIIGNFAEDFGIPSQVVNVFFIIATSILTVLIIFAILNAGSGSRV